TGAQAVARTGAGVHARRRSARSDAAQPAAAEADPAVEPAPSLLAEEVTFRDALLVNRWREITPRSAGFSARAVRDRSRVAAELQLRPYLRLETGTSRFSLATARATIAA